MDESDGAKKRFLYKASQLDSVGTGMASYEVYGHIFLTIIIIIKIIAGCYNYVSVHVYTEQRHSETHAVDGIILRSKRISSMP